MKSCEYDGPPLMQALRTHPWTAAASNSAFRYHDLKAEPALIRTALEDFCLFDNSAAVTKFYELLERVNGPGSTLESNDCAFSGPHESEAPELGTLQCDGRVMILFRAIPLNRSWDKVQALTTAVHMGLASHDAAFEQGMIGTTLTPVDFLDPSLSDELRGGWQLMVSFWAWGDSQAAVMDNLCRVFKNLDRALESAAH